MIIQNKTPDLLPEGSQLKSKFFKTKARTFFLGGLFVAIFSVFVMVREAPVPIKRKVKLTLNQIRALTAQPLILDLDTGYVDLQKLAYQREKALQKGLMTADLKESVNATLGAENKSFKAEVKLKGRWLDHLLSEKWSMALDLKDSTWNGMRGFSLRHPATRGYLSEWVYHQALQREKILSPRYEFVALRLNGRDKGIYSLEENLGLTFAKNAGHPHGVFLTFESELYYNPTRDGSGKLSNHLKSGVESEISSFISPIQSKEVLAHPDLKKQFLLSQTKLELFRRKKASAKETLDIEKWARYFAVSELFGATDAIYDWKDLVFFWNPTTQLLEPVGSEGGKATVRGLVGANHNIGKPRNFQFHELLFSDHDFFSAYIAALEEVTSETYLKKLFQEMRPGITKNERFIHKEWPEENYTHQILETNATLLSKALEPISSVRAYIKEAQGNAILLQMSNIQFLPVEVLALKDKKNKRFLPAESILLSPKTSEDPLEFHTFKFEGPSTKEIDPRSLEVEVRILGSRNTAWEKILPWPYLEGV